MADAQQQFSDTLLIVNFENVSEGAQGSSFVDFGFRFTDGGAGSEQDLLVVGASSGYVSQTLHSSNYARSVTLDRAVGTAFDLASIDYAAGQWNGFNNLSADTNVTGFVKNGSSVSASFTTTYDPPETSTGSVGRLDIV